MLSLGSCAVEYTLYLTPKGREKYLSQGHKTPFSNFQEQEPSSRDKYTSSFFLFTIYRRIKYIISKAANVIIEYPLLLLVAMWLGYYVLKQILYGVFTWLFPQGRRARTQPRQPRMPFWSGFFGGGGDDPPGPPPPYSRQPPPSRKTYQVPPETQGWTPGFWTGLASGTAAGYGLGSMRNGRTEQGYQPRRYAEDAAARSSGWFGGNRSPGQGYSPSSWRNEDDNGGYGTHTSTGFGGTRRR